MALCAHKRGLAHHHHRFCVSQPQLVKRDVIISLVPTSSFQSCVLLCMGVIPSLIEKATVAEILCMMNPMQRFLLDVVVNNDFLDDREASPLGETPSAWTCEAQGGTTQP